MGSVKKATTPRAKSTKQDYHTDPRFFKIANGLFNFKYDLAADSSNNLCPDYFSEEQDSLKQDWHKIMGWCWLNPPFSHIRPWAKKCYEESLKGASIILLTPASVGAQWFQEWNWKKSELWFLQGRLIFPPKTDGYPKDCMISIFNPNVNKSLIKIWDWEENRFY